MLFAYPTAAAAENWLHECLVVILKSGMDDIDSGRQRAGWPDCIPAERRDRLQRFVQLQGRFESLLTIYEALDIGSRRTIRDAMGDQEAFRELFDGGRRADRLDDLPETARDSVKRFFEKAFEMLKPLGLRDANYRNFLRLIEHRICAFCGCEYFSGATSKREPLDHYLAISIYPFAGANARNLVPMGTKCNSSYKLAQDVLRDDAGARRVCFDPYNSTPVRISLLQSKLFARSDGLPEWNVQLEGDAARIRTWDAVFEVKRRFIDDHLDSLYKQALKVFGTLWQKWPDVLPAKARLCDAFRHLGDLSRAKGWSDRAFLETALYELLVTRCEAGGAEADRIAAEFSSATLAVG